MMASAANDPRKAGLIWTMGLDEPSPVVIPDLVVTFGQAGPEAIDVLAPVMAGITPSDVLGRFEMGRRCYAGWVNGSLAAYGWVSFEGEFIGELRLQIGLQPGEAYIWDCVTLPAYRQKHLYSALLVYILSQLRAEGLRRTWIGADLENEPSQRGIARAGFQCVAVLAISRVVAMRMVQIQGWPGAPDHLVAEARRVFLGDRDKVWLKAIRTLIA